MLDLDEALRTDLGWLRQQTVLQEQSARWVASGALPDSPHLLRGDVLAEAHVWAQGSPSNALVPANVSAFLSASDVFEAKLKAEAHAGIAEREAALRAAQEAAAKQQRAERGLRTFGVVALVAGILLTLAAAAGGWLAWTGFQELGRERAELASAQSKLAEAQSSLAASEIEVGRQREQVARAQNDLMNSREETKRQEEVAAAVRMSANTQIASSLLSDYEGIRPRCLLLTDALFPFFPNALDQSESSEYLTGVQRMFGVDGELTQLKQKVDPYLDRSGPVWRWQKVDGVTDRFDADSAVQLQKAARILEYLTAGLELKLEAIRFGSSITSVEFAVGEQMLRFKPGEQTATSIKWVAVPVDARLALYSGEARTSELSSFGSWSLFALMRRARFEQAGPTAVNATFGDGASSVTMKVTFPTADHPFGRSSPWTFRCPSKL